jgi:hypothetical protein
MRLEALLQQLHLRRNDIRLPLGRDVSGDRVGRSLDQHAEDGVQVNFAFRQSC